MSGLSSIAPGLTIVKSRQLLYRVSAVTLFLALLAPLVVHFGLYYPFVSGKLFYFRTLVEVSFFAYLVLAYKYRQFKPGWAPILSWAGLLVGVQFVAAVVGVDPMRSLFGDLERGEGVLTSLHLLLFCFLLVQLMRSPSDWRLLVAVWVLVSTAVAGIGLMQWIQSGGPMRPGSTLGNASYLAGYLLFGIFFAAWLSVKSRSLNIKLAASACSIVMVAALLITATRSALIGGLAGAGLIVAVLLTDRFRKASPVPRTRIIGWLLLIAVLSATVYSLAYTPLTELTMFRRLSSLSLEATSVQSRILIWKAGVAGLGKRPILGFGPENFQVAFNQEFPPELFTMHPQMSWADRAHNSILETGVTSGLIGIVAWLGLYGAALLGLGFWRHRQIRAPTLILTGALVAHFVNSLMSIDSLGPEIGFWFLLALVAAGGRMESLSTAGVPHSQPTAMRTTLVGLGAAVLLPVVVWTFNVRPESMCRQLADGAAASKAGRREAAFVHLSKAIEGASIYATDARKVMAETILAWLDPLAGGPPVQPAHVDHAIQNLEEVVIQRPNDLRAWILLAMLRNRSAAQNPGRVALALEATEHALALSPTHPQTYFERGQAYLFQRDFENALQSFQHAAHLAPQSAEARWNLAMALLIAGRASEAELELRRLQEEGVDLSEPRYLVRLLAAYRSAGLQDQASALVDQLRAPPEPAAKAPP